MSESIREKALIALRQHVNLFHADLISAAMESDQISTKDFFKGCNIILAAEFNDLDEFVPSEFKNLVEDYEDMPNPDNVRCCSHCGFPMKDGYYLGGEYTCTKECAIALYNGDKAQFESDLEEEEKHNYGEVYYTEWESFYFE